MSSQPEIAPKSRRSFLDLADQTPADRDRYVDFLRAFSICVVVLGHWLVTVVYWKNGRLVGINALEVIPGLWLATWLLQVMPMFFFVGGFSNSVTLDSLSRKGLTYSDFVHMRAQRLLRPTAVLLIVWLPLSAALEAFLNLNERAYELSMMLLTAPLWFLAVYLMMISLAPKMLKIHRRYGKNALAAMAAGAVIVDVAVIQFDVPFIGGLNYLFIWLFAHQLGFFYADGSLLRLGRKVHIAMAVGGLMGLVLLTTVGGYTPNMVFNVRGRSNTNPPTVGIMVLTIWQVGLAMLLRDRISLILQRRRPWARVIALNGMMMTMFLWHMTAALIVVVFAYPAGFPAPRAGTAQWWLLRPVWVAMLTVILAVLVAAFVRFEKGLAPGRKSGSAAGLPLSPVRRTATVLGLIYCILGFVGFATSSFTGFARPEGAALMGLTMNPLQSVLHLVIGWSLLNAGHKNDRAARAACVAAALTFFALGFTGMTVLAGNPGLNYINANGAVNVLHLGSALAAVSGLRRTREPAR